MNPRSPHSLAILISLFALATQLAGAEPPPKLAEKIRTAALATAERLATDTARWRTTLKIPGGTAAAVVERHRQGLDLELVEIKLRAPSGVSQIIASIISKKGLWYVREPERLYVCRPFEAVLALPVCYQFLVRSELQLLTELETLEQLGEFVSVDGERATFRTPLPEENLNYLRSAEPVLTKALEDPKKDRVEIETQLRTIRALLANGLTTVVNVRTGVLETTGAPEQRMVVEQFEWLSNPEPELFSVAHDQWQDETKPLADDPADRENVVAISHCPIWRPGGPQFSDHCVLLNVRTGAIRRVPFPDSELLASCFSADRAKLYGSGTVSNEGRMGLFEIDLVSGATRELATGQLQGIPLFPTLSADGSTLACVAGGTKIAGGDMSADPTEMLKSQVQLVDVATGASQKLGEPLDTAMLSWLPDSSGLLLITRKNRGLDQPSEESLARMNLHGEITELGPGTFPTLVQNGTRIMYLVDGRKKPRTWFTCELDGSQAQQIGDGLDGFNFPSPSPAGDRVLMMKFGGPEGPRPYLIEIPSGKATPIPVGQGLWTKPAWK